MSLFKDNSISGPSLSSAIVDRRNVFTRFSREKVLSADAVTTGSESAI